MYNLNPEIIESAYYLYHFTGNPRYMETASKYWQDIKTHCRTDIAFTSIEDVTTMEQRDYMATYFIAETLKYFYLIFSYEQGIFDFEDYIFNTEAHPFKRSHIDKSEAAKRLGFRERY